MRAHHRSLASLFVLSAALPSCSSSDDGSASPEGSTGAKVDGGTQLDGGGGTSAGGTGGGTNTGGGSSGAGGGSGGVALQDGSFTAPQSDGGGEASCAPPTVPVQVLLVVDKSATMADQPSGFSVDKWEALKSAVGAALNGAKAQIGAGLELFPVPDGCTVPSSPSVPIEDGTTAVPKIIAQLEAATPGGLRPTSDALAAALDYFTTGAGASLAGDRFVILATDGGPNCNALLLCSASSCTSNLEGTCSSGTNCCQAEPERCLDVTVTESRIRALRDEGIDTFVVGLPGSEAYDTPLNNLALAGGRERQVGSTQYYAVDPSGGTAGLTLALEEILAELVPRCSS